MSTSSGPSMIRSTPGIGAVDTSRQSSRDDDAPAFRLDLHGTQAAARRLQSKDARDATQAAADDARRVSHRDRVGGDASGRDVVAKKHASEQRARRDDADATHESGDARRTDARVHPNASRTHAGRHDDGTVADEAAAADDASSDDVAEAGTTSRRPTSNTDDDNSSGLPDRMLALLGGSVLPGATATTPTASSGAATADGGALAGTAVSLTGTPPTGTLATLLAPGSTDASTAQAGVTPMLTSATGDASPLAATGTANHTAPNLLALGALLPGASASASTPSASTSATDGVAALAAAITGRGASRDGDGATSGPAAPDTSTTAFQALLARGAEGVRAAASTVAAAAPAPTLAFDAGFDDGIGERVLWMANERIGHAEIRVTPDALGPIDIRVQMDGHRVHAQFQAANADVRQSLEAGMDRLRDMLGRHGMELGNAHVGNGSAQNGQGRGTSPSFVTGAGDDTPADAPVATTVRVLRGRGLLDEYA